MGGIIEFLLLIAFGFFKDPEMTVDKLEQMHEVSIASHEGITLNETLVSAINNDVISLAQCQYQNGNTAYLLVGTTGQITTLYISNERNITHCLLEPPIKINSSPHNSNFVAKVNL